MKNKMKITLGTLSTLTVIATPVAVAVSCGKTENKEEERIPNNIGKQEPQKKSNLVENIKISLDLDKAFKNAKKNATDVNIKNNTIGDFIVINGKKKSLPGRRFFDATNPKYIEPTSYVISDVLKQALESLSNALPSAKVILDKLSKDNGLYKITNDVLKSIFDEPHLTLRSINKKLSLRNITQNGLMTLFLTLQGETISPNELIINVINAIWKNTKDDLKKADIKVNELSQFLHDLDGKKVSLSFTQDGKTTELLKNKKINTGVLTAVLDLKDTREITGVIDPFIPLVRALINVSDDSFKDIIDKLVNPPKSKTTSTDTKTKAKKPLDIGEIMGKMGKVDFILKKIMLRDISKLDKQYVLTPKDTEELMKVLPISDNLKKFVGPLLNILSKTAELYQE